MFPAARVPHSHPTFPAACIPHSLLVMSHFPCLLCPTHLTHCIPCTSPITSHKPHPLHPTCPAIASHMPHHCIPHLPMMSCPPSGSGTVSKLCPRPSLKTPVRLVHYHWFSNMLGDIKSSPHHSHAAQCSQNTQSPPEWPIGLSNASTAVLQFTPSPQFVDFMHKLLQTTQVSQSVIVLSLHYIYQLKDMNQFMSGQPGSEFRVTMVALMMANKFVDG